MAAQEQASFQEIEESLTCQCGCGLTVHSCNHLQCPSAIPLRQEIREQLDKGLGKEAILQYFSGKYGEKILSAPTTTGFNLAAWVTPFFALAAAAAILIVTLMRWQRRTTALRAAAAPAPTSGESPGGKYEDLLRKELDEFDR